MKLNNQIFYVIQLMHKETDEKRRQNRLFSERSTWNQTRRERENVLIDFLFSFINVHQSITDSA